VRGRYDKHVLVPFGERWPLIETFSGVYRGVFGALNLPMLVSTTPGPGRARCRCRRALGPLATGICYESVFPAISAGDGGRRRRACWW
jgi:apolipoprotein N-acyltransferase